MLKAAKCLPEKAMQNNTVAQRATAEAGRAPTQPPCPTTGCFHAHAGYPCCKSAGKGVLFQSKIFPDEACAAERQGTRWHSPFTGMTRAFWSCKSEIVPRPCPVGSRRSTLMHEPQQAQPGGSLLSCSRGDREHMGTRATSHAATA